jgi:hypothetical protein
MFMDVEVEDSGMHCHICHKNIPMRLREDHNCRVTGELCVLCSPAAELSGDPAVQKFLCSHHPGSYAIHGNLTVQYTLSNLFKSCLISFNEREFLNLIQKYSKNSFFKAFWQSHEFEELRWSYDDETSEKHIAARVKGLIGVESDNRTARVLSKFLSYVARMIVESDDLNYMRLNDLNRNVEVYRESLAVGDGDVTFPLKRSEALSTFEEENKPKDPPVYKSKRHWYNVFRRS